MNNIGPDQPIEVKDSVYRCSDCSHFEPPCEVCRIWERIHQMHLPAEEKLPGMPTYTEHCAGCKFYEKMFKLLVVRGLDLLPAGSICWLCKEDIAESGYIDVEKGDVQMWCERCLRKDIE